MQLSSDEFFQQDHGWRSAERFLSHLEQGGPTEVAFTNLLCAADGPFERELVRRFLKLAGHEDADRLASEMDSESGRPRYRVIGAHDISAEFRRREGRMIQIAPDVFIGERFGGDDGAVGWRPRVAMEVKFGAMVNSHFDYCPAGEHVMGNGPEGDRAYSSQVICYPRNCWLAPGAKGPDAYIWMGPRPHLVSPAFIDREKVEAFARSQQEHLETWRHVSLDEVIGESGAMVAGGLADLASVLRERLAAWRR